jgi:hypothetical protein
LWSIAKKLAVESGRHTDPAMGNSYRTFVVWKPEAAHVTYIHDDELNERYKAVTPEWARTWWTQKYARSRRLKPSKRTLSAAQSFRFGSG